MTTTTQPTQWQARHAATSARRLRWHLPIWIAFGTLGAVGLFWLRDGGLDGPDLHAATVRDEPGTDERICVTGPPHRT